MMEIIEEQPFRFEFECRKCGSKLAAGAEDVKIGLFGANYGGDTPSREYYVTCPVCETDRTLERTQVTPKVQRMADAKKEE